MLEATFFSDTGQSLFEQDLKERQVRHMHISRTHVLVPDAPLWVEDLARELGADVSQYRGELEWL